MSETANIRKYTVAELHAVAADDRWAVRDEALRRHSIAARALARMLKDIAELEAILNRVM